MSPERKTASSDHDVDSNLPTFDDSDQSTGKTTATEPELDTPSHSRAAGFWNPTRAIAGRQASASLGNPNWNMAHFWWVLLGGVVGLFLGTVFVFSLFGEDPSTNTLLLVVMSCQYGGHLLTILLLSWAKGMPLRNAGLFFASTDPYFLLGGVALQFALLLLIYPLSRLLEIDDTPQIIVEQLEEVSGWWVRLLLFLMIVVLAPLVEEVIFRGIMLDSLAKNHRFGLQWAVLISSGSFALMHLLGISGPYWRAAILVFSQLSIVGLVLAWLTVRYKRLGPAIFAHAGFNLVAAMFIFGIS